MAQDCPRCGMVNPPEAQRCDCGFDFLSQSVKESFLTLKEHIRGKDDRPIPYQPGFLTRFLTGVFPR